MKVHGAVAAIAVLGALISGLSACGGGDNSSSAPEPFSSTKLVSDGSVAVAHSDPNLQNGWGVAFNPTGAFWVSDNTTHKSSLYDGNGTVQSLSVSIPDGSRGPAGPTGIVFNLTNDFMISSGGNSSKAVFVWATDMGTIAAWSPKVLPTQAVTAFDDQAGGAIYKGLTAATVNGKNMLYAADFRNGKVDVFNAAFQKVQLDGQFKDPTLPAGFAPFGIQSIGNTVFVTYAKQNGTASAQVVGAGFGILDEFDTSGHFVKQIIGAGGVLNAPWGMAEAPSNFGPLSNDLLVGNFGDGTIEAFDPNTGQDLGKLIQKDGKPFVQPGLWGMSFGNDVDNQPKNTLFYAAGPSKTTGAFGRIEVAPIVRAVF